jgi:general secretion pathway protein H
LQSTKNVRQGGFTLLEMLVVLVIMGIIITFATLSVGPRENQVEIEASRFAALVRLAQEQAVLTTTEYAVRFEPDGYQFLRLVKDKWEKVQDDELLRPRLLPEEFEMELLLEGEEIDILNQSADEALADQKFPRLYLLSSGEILPFSVTFRNRYAKTAMAVRGSLLDGVTVSTVETES